MDIDWEDQFAEDRHRFPDNAEVIIRLPGDTNDGKKGEVASVFSERTRHVRIDKGRPWHYCIAALRSPL